MTIAALRRVEDVLASYPPETHDLALRTRKLILGALPRIDETIDASARLLGYGYGPGYRGSVCVLIPSRSGVKLGFYRGTDLPDPEGLLEGSGKVHRHVPLKTVADLKRPGLRDLLKAAKAAWKARSGKAAARGVVLLLALAGCAMAAPPRVDQPPYLHGQLSAQEQRNFELIRQIHERPRADSAPPRFRPSDPGRGVVGAGDPSLRRHLEGA